MTEVSPSMAKEKSIPIQCEWDNCALEFGNAIEHRKHCVAHIQVQLAATGFQINLPVETWTEVFSSCGLISLTNRVSFSRRLFHAIARSILDGPKGRVLPEMAFLQSTQSKRSILLKRVPNAIGGGNRLVEVPVAEVPPPRNVVGFSRIALKCFDANVLSFLGAIRSLFSHVQLELGISSGDALFEHQQLLYEWGSTTERYNLAALEYLLRAFPLLLEGAITSLCIFAGIELVSPKLLDRLLANVRHLRINGCALPDPEPSNSGNCSPQHLPVLVKWLHIPAEDGHQKMASLNIGSIENFIELVSHAKQHFLSTTSTPISYFVVFYSRDFEDVNYPELPSNRMRNECTGEVLTLCHYNEVLDLGGYIHNFVLYRRICASEPKEEDEETDLAAIFESMPRTPFSAESRNRLTLNIAQMGTIDGSLFPAEEELQNGEDGSGSGKNSNN